MNMKFQFYLIISLLTLNKGVKSVIISVGIVDLLTENVHVAPVKLGRFKFFVMVTSEQNRTSRMTCGGFIVNSWFVFTSASCIARNHTSFYNFTGIKIQGGLVKDSLQRHMQSRMPLNISLHPLWDPAFRYVENFALIQVNKPFTINPILGTVCFNILPPSTGTKCILINWTYYNNQKITILTKLRVKVLSREPCSRPYANKHLVCAAAHNPVGGYYCLVHTAGSVLVCNNLINGVLSSLLHSRDIPCGLMNVSTFYKWMIDQSNSSAFRISATLVLIPIILISNIE